MTSQVNNDPNKNLNPIISNQAPQQKKQAEWEGHKFIYITAAAATISFLAVALYELAKYVAELTHDKIWAPDIPALEKTIKKKFDEKFIDRLKVIPGVDYIRLFKHLAICKKDEEEIVKKLQSEYVLTDEQIKEILGGAHVRLKDGGRTYEEWVNRMSTKQARMSSHPSSSTQFGIRGPFVKELLFSKIEVNGEQYTWFQLENHPVKFGHFLRHMKDYFVYKLSGKNQGPYGSSPAIDSKPLVLEPRAEQA